MNNTSLLQRHDKSLVSARTLLENGQMGECSLLSELQEELDCTMFQSLSTTNCQSKMMKEKRKATATVESHPKTKKTTFKDKFNTCKNITQTTESSQISDQDSTLKEKAFDPSLNWLPKVESEKLWLPIETGSVASHSNWLSGSFKSIKSKSWFSIKRWTPLKKKKWQKTFLPLSMFSIAELTEKESTKTEKKRTNKIRKSTKPVANMSQKVGLRPTPEVAKILKGWFGAVRTTYNWALSCIKAKPKEYQKSNMIWLRKRFINKCNIPKSKRYLLDTPKSIRDTAVSDLAEAYKANYAKKALNPGHSFDLKFRRKKDDQCITITSDQIKNWDSDKGEFKMFPTFLKNKIKFYTRKNKMVPDKVSYDCKLLMNRLGRFSLVIVFHEAPCESQTGKNQCSLDPGVRTFQTVYSPTPGLCYKIGHNDMKRIFRLCKHLDTMISQKVKRKAQMRLRSRIRNLVTELHCKTAKFLLSKFNEIILPSFNVSQMVKRSNRKIRSKTVRQMLCWRHYGFKQRLLMAAERIGAKVYIRGEEYTSKTCTHCRNVKNNLGGAKMYKCSECKLVADRDCCGARNIFIKNTKAP